MKVKQNLTNAVSDVKHVWRAAEHLVASLSLVIVSVYTGTSAYNRNDLRQLDQAVLLGASLVIGIIAARELFKYFKSVKLDS